MFKLSLPPTEVPITTTAATTTTTPNLKMKKPEQESMITKNNLQQTSVNKK
jgi:hypothetical protein